MTNFHRIWQGDVNRWHSHPNRKLRNSGDTVHAHAARCCMLLIHLHPKATAGLIAACLHHDTAESWTGDTPAGAKQDWPGLRDELRWAEMRTTEKLDLPTSDSPWIKLVDRLDAYLWMVDVAPEEESKEEWIDCFRDITARAANLGVEDKLPW